MYYEYRSDNGNMIDDVNLPRTRLTWSKTLFDQS